MGMNNATPRNAVRIVNSRALSLLEQLLASARGEALPTPAAACPELAQGGEQCSGNGTTLSTYLAPRRTYWAVNYAGEDFEAGRTYFRRCKLGPVVLDD